MNYYDERKLRVKEITEGNWAVIDDCDQIIKVFTSNAAAWLWVDRNTCDRKHTPTS